ncbi:hypothetical protein M404DRAFT_996459 [Pisolithus tinctorius Marx 270]|uniref:Uncharacterized protein n=1 Tax=Pisolithus tinctorius Marx 270 TaxID=870435 RepID=A0A0C3JKF9_PISTI|nr:hypothetical protein M404DRAFT_996459 [Pisolithus tinctorius Marx 270]
MLVQLEDSNGVSEFQEGGNQRLNAVGDENQSGISRDSLNKLSSEYTYAWMPYQLMLPHKH